MTLKVGIPRALLFHEYYPLWTSFFQELGAEVILSDKTSKRILDMGVKNTVDEACLPVQLFHGHVLDIKDKVDFLFIPRIRSLYQGEHICPKFCGLPEMIKFSIKDLPAIIDTEINLVKSKDTLKNTLYEIGKHFTSDVKCIENAYKTALVAYKNHKADIHRGMLPRDGKSVLRLVNPQKTSLSKNKRIMIMGHPYNLYDTYLNMNAIDKLLNYGMEVLTPEMLDGRMISQYAAQYDGRLYWTFARKLIGTALYLIENKNIDGIIYISTFGCGVDSVVADIVEKRIRRESSIPFMLVTIDEHSGEAGINTRIEAFIDMVKWRGTSENNISAHG